ncbi:CHAP domain-containing protein [Novosphingobium aquimarinum]|uniref:CHAP domain-containing protein n=1 Tax=Novosphingobium aquimarinum TaxID=2682494 RepID=UPI002FC354B7
MMIRPKSLAIGTLAALAATTPTTATAQSESSTVSNLAGKVLQCVPYARRLTGITIFGDAHTWWNQAQGRYARGHQPREGAVLAIKPYANSKLGHVAAVSKVVDARTILISHANWSGPGKIEKNVTALDVSADNDWSRVRVWYGPTHKLGTTKWPVAGFIYPDGKAPKGLQRAASNRRSSLRDAIGAIISGTY